MRLRIVVPLLASAVIVAALCCLRRHRSESVECVEASLSRPYPRVLLALGQKSSFESILSSGGATLVSKEWDDFKVDLRTVPRLSSWEIRGQGRFRVRSESGDFSGEMELTQSVDADRSGIRVLSELPEPSGFVRVCSTETSISNSDPVTIRVEGRIVYERTVPFWACVDVDERVRNHNRRRLEAMVGVIKQIVDGPSATLWRR